MGKYETLRQFLNGQRDNVVPMTFAEIERLTGDSLPSSRQSQAWWDGATNVVTQTFRDAGFMPDHVDADGNSITLRRVAAEQWPIPGRHPLIGCMKGTVTIMPGVDLTAPSEWSEYLDEVYGVDRES